MATSGSVDYSVTADDIITRALRVAGVTKEGTAPSTAKVTEGMNLLNLMVKAWMSDGLQLWARKKATLFLALNTSEYSLGPSGDHATASYTETALAADAAASATALTVDSITGISAADNIGVVLDDGTLHWDTVNGAPSGSTVNITNGLASAASEDGAIYVYTTKIDRPLKIIEAYIQDSDNKDIPVTVSSLNEYVNFNDKTSDGKVSQISYDPQLTNGKLRTWPQSDSVTDTLEFYYHRPFEDFDATTDTPDFPQEWYLALVYGLASMLCDTYNVHPTKASRVNKRAMQYKEDVSDFDAEDGSIFFSPSTSRRR